MLLVLCFAHRQLHMCSHLPFLQIKSIIGVALVDKAEVLHAEVSTLLEIWTDYHRETLKKERKCDEERMIIHVCACENFW